MTNTVECIKCFHCGSTDFTGYICNGCNHTNIPLWSKWMKEQFKK